VKRRIIRGTWNCIQTTSVSKAPEDSIGAREVEAGFFRLLFRRELAIAFGLLAHAEKTGLIGKALVDRLLDRLIMAGYDG
jgi:hypothetical protein